MRSADMDSNPGSPPDQPTTSQVHSPHGTKRARHQLSQLATIREDPEDDNLLPEPHPITKIGPPRGQKRTQGSTSTHRPAPHPQPKARPLPISTQPATISPLTPDPWSLPTDDHTPAHFPWPTPTPLPPQPVSGSVTSDNDEDFDVPLGGYNDDDNEENEHDFQGVGGPPPTKLTTVNESVSSGPTGLS